MFAIISTSFKEVLRKKILHLIAFLTLIYLVLLGVLIHLVAGGMHSSGVSSMIMFSNISTIISLIGFYFSTMVVAFLTIMVSIGSISSEIEGGTIYAIITKPIKRSEYVLGKFLGLAIPVTIYSIALFCAVLFMPSLAGISILKYFKFNQLAWGLVYFILEPLVILSISIYGSASFKTLSNGIFVISLYILGSIGGMMEQIGLVINNKSLVSLGIVSSLISPFDIVYRKMISSIFSSYGLKNLLLGPSFISGSSTSPSRWMMIYVCLYLLIFVAFAVSKFEKKDI